MILTFTVSLPRFYSDEGDEPWKATLEMDESTTLEDFHKIIQEAVDFDNDHLFAFFTAKSERSYERTLFDDEHGGLQQTLGELFPLVKGLRLFYLFDFGDEWLFKISKSRKKPRAPEPDVTYPRIVKEVGSKPVQYPDWDEYEEDNEDWDEDVREILEAAANIDTEQFVLPPVPLPDVQATFALPIMHSHGMGVFEVAGFTLATISAPKNIPFSEWSPRVFKEGTLPKFSSMDETQTVLSGLTTLWNHWAATIDNDFGLPPECVVDEDNQPSEALRAFCDGYNKAMASLDNIWEDLVFKDLMQIDPDDEALSNEDMDNLDRFMKHVLLLDSCDFYSSADTDEMFSDDEHIDDIIDFNLLPALMQDSALLGREIGIQNIKGIPASSFDDFDDSPQLSLPFSTPHEPYVNPDNVGRNDPCPCGSGKKFKKCCLY